MGVSIKGILFGLVAIPVCVILLWSNEGRAVTTANSLKEGAAAVVAVAADKVDAANDKILVDGRPIKRNEPMVYVMLFKPKGIVCTNEDPEGRRRAVDLVQHPQKVRVYPVGRLDYDA